MKAEMVTGPHATPKGLHHAFGIKAVTTGVPLNMVQKWLGHAQLSTTSIYKDATGPEAKQIAERMWAHG
jgi:integrase/recombinase XerD